MLSIYSNNRRYLRFCKRLLTFLMSIHSFKRFLASIRFFILNANIVFDAKFYQILPNAGEICIKRNKALSR